MMHRKLSEFLGDKPYGMEVFETFANHPGEALSPPDLEAITDVPHTTLYRILRSMEASDGIHKVGERGRASLYRLNTSHPVVRTFADAVLQAQTEALEAEIQQDAEEREATISVDELVISDFTEETDCFHRRAT